MNKSYTFANLAKPTIIEEYVDFKGKQVFRYKTESAMESFFKNKRIKTNLSKEDWIALGKNPATLNVVDLYKTWNTHPKRREVNDVIFDSKAFFDNDKQGFYNLFKVFEIPADTLEDVKSFTAEEEKDEAFFQHILNRWCGGRQEIYKNVLDMFASIYQKPWQKLHLSLVLTSTERAGKCIILEIFKDIIGADYYFQPSDVKEILGDFNAQLAKAIVVFMDEMVWGGDKERARTIKKLVSENTLTLKQKYLPNLT